MGAGVFAIGSVGNRRGYGHAMIFNTLYYWGTPAKLLHWIGALMILLIASIGILSVDKTHVVFVQDVVPKVAGSKPFSSTGELVFLGFAMIVGLVAAPIQAASRSLLARLAPADKITQFFGLFAFSGKVTAFLAPFVVASVTAMTNQRIGIASVLAFLIIGAALMLFVRTNERPR